MENKKKFLKTYSWMNFAELHMQIQNREMAITCYNRAINTLCSNGVSKSLFVAYEKFEEEEKKNGVFSSCLLRGITLLHH